MAQFQSGQYILSPIGQARLPADNGGAQVAAINLKSGSFIADEATPVVVADTDVTANSVIVFTLKTVGGTLVAGQGPNVLTITPGVGFTIGAAATDTSTYNYLIVG